LEISFSNLSLNILLIKDFVDSKFDFMIFSSLPSIGWFWPRDPSHGFERLTWVDLRIFFPDPFLQLFFMIPSFYKVISILCDRSWVSQVSLSW
jgi:hypothetical protein